MTNRISVLVFFACLFASCLSAEAPRVVMETSLGPIILEVYPDKAPISANNFLRYVDEGRFEGAHFYRVVHMNNQPNNKVKIEVIQGGLGFADSDHRLPPIEHETTNEIGLKHLDGTLSMARLEPGTASSEFFICVGDQPELDFGGKRNPDGQGFSAFGQVIEGMDVVRKIQKRPEDGQMLVETIPTTIRRVDSSLTKSTIVDDEESQVLKDQKINYLELPARDLDAVQRFYEGTFGWSFTDYGPEYRAFNDGTIDGGFRLEDAQSSMSNGAALIVLYASNLEQTRGNIRKNGGEIVKDIFSFPGGRRFHFTDPNGNELAVWSDK